DNSVTSVKSPTTITDPGESNRAEHLWGDRLVIRTGRIIAWLFPLLMVAIVIQVNIRKFGFNQAWLDDAQWWMYGIAMLTAFGYSISTESHVRVDIFHQNYSAAKKARIELFALGWLLLPFLILMTDIMTHYAISSWTAGEGSDSPNGLHMLYLLKMALPVLFMLAILAAMSALYRHLIKLTPPAVWKYILAGLPAFIFLAERVVNYVIWWHIRISQPDLSVFSINDEPLFDWALPLGTAIVMAVILAAFLAARRSTTGSLNS
ncbi:MAG: TRAP transporter small permease subunit, partial [Rhodospirillales bacterium]